MSILRIICFNGVPVEKMTFRDMPVEKIKRVLATLSSIMIQHKHGNHCKLSVETERNITVKCKEIESILSKTAAKAPQVRYKS